MCCPATFKSAAAGALTKKFGSEVAIQIALEDCVGYELSVVQCPMKATECRLSALFVDV